MRGADDTKSEASGYSYATKSYAQSEWGGRAQSTMGLDVPRGPSRMSLAPSEIMSQRGSTYMGNYGEMEMRTLELPSDDAILAEIREILQTADLMTVTKKSIKAELERKFGVSLDAKRAYVNSGMIFLVRFEVFFVSNTNGFYLGYSHRSITLWAVIMIINLVVFSSSDRAHGLG